jgi:hypothetical protein
MEHSHQVKPIEKLLIILLVRKFNNKPINRVLLDKIVLID